MKQTISKLLVVLALTLTTSSNYAQGSSISGDTLINMMIKDWTRGKAYTDEYLSAMPAAKYSFRAHDSVRTFAQQMLHLAQANIFFVMTATGATPPFGRRDLENSPSAQSADSVRYVVEKSYDFAIDAIRKVNPATLMEIKSFNMGQTITGPKLSWLYKGFEHQTHHRGQTTIYLRLSGVKPPQEKLF